MAVRTAEELIESISVLNTDDTKDLYVSLLEDITDSIPKDLAEIRQKLADAEEKAKQVEDEWRERYINRFGGLEESKAETQEEETPEVEEKEEYTTEDMIEEMKEG